LVFPHALERRPVIFLNSDPRYLLALQSIMLKRQSMYDAQRQYQLLQNKNVDTSFLPSNSLEKSSNVENIIEDYEEKTVLIPEEVNQEVQIQSSETTCVKDQDILDNSGVGSTCDSTDNSVTGGESESPSVPKVLKDNNFKSLKYKQKRRSHDTYTPKKNGKSKKKPESKAHNLWINYGRKIVDFAISNTNGEFQNQIRGYFGRLVTKKDYLEVFGTKPTDKAEDTTFKVLFGRIAIYFIKTCAEKAFRDSKYRSQMIDQRHLVIDLIAKLIGLK